MASIEIRHGRKCALDGARTRTLEGCSGKPLCRPSYTILVRTAAGFDRHPSGANKREAEQLRDKLSVGVFEGSYAAPKKIKFGEWADGWVESLERKENTKRDYRRTVAYAKEAFGERQVRTIGPGDVSKFNALLRDRGSSASTRAKHLRVLGACLQSALVHGYAGKNPVRSLPPSEKPRVEHKEAAYFEIRELKKIIGEIQDPMYRTLFIVAAKTGMRQGELVALTWGDIDLVDEVIAVRRNYTAGQLSDPKNREKRDVDLIAEAGKALEEWKAEAGWPDDDKLVFPGDGPSGYLSTSTLTRRVLYPAMERAKVPRVGPTGEKRTFHSLRHSFAKRSLELGLQATWLQRQLGHSSLLVTTGIYGHWQRSERKREAAMLEGSFGFE